MNISIVNHTEMPEEEVHHVIRAVNRQLEYDFAPHWHVHASMRLEGRLDRDPDLYQMGMNMRGNGIIYLEDDVDVMHKWRGWHRLNFAGIPYGFVFTKFSEKRGVPWSITFSHEVIELIADPETNRFVMGPHPDPAQYGRPVWHAYEICDAVQAESYTVDDVEVSNFVLPLYYTSGEEFEGFNDFLSRPGADGKRLRSFGVNAGGYVAFYDPMTFKIERYFADDDAVAYQKEKQDHMGATQRMQRKEHGYQNRG